mgnify:CR=1 FL=1
MEIAGELIGMGAKAIVVACNTATAAAVEAMRAAYPQIPIIGTEPAVKPAADAGHRHILVLATPVTVAEERFSALIHSRCGTAEVIAVPCPGLATMIEEGHTSDELICKYLDGIFAPLRGKFDAVVLGCTHYPLARVAISRAAGGIFRYMTARQERQDRQPGAYPDQVLAPPGTSTAAFDFFQAETPEK